METINEAIEMNNGGVSSLLSGKDTMAAWYLVNALKIMKRVLTRHDVGGDVITMRPKQHKCASYDCSDAAVSAVSAEPSGAKCFILSHLCPIFLMIGTSSTIKLS